jgi:hypothetical protein
VVISVEEFKVQADRFAAVENLSYPIIDFKLFVCVFLFDWSGGTSAIVQFAQQLIRFRS